MKAKEHVKNNDINLQADALIDLAVTDETKAGPDYRHPDLYLNIWINS